MEIPANQLAEMHAILDQEAGESPFSDSERRWFRRLDRFGYAWLVVSVLVGAYGAFVQLVLNENDFSYVVRLFVVMTLWFSPCSIATYVLMFSLNWRQILATLKLEKEVWKLGYGEMLAAPWRDERAKHRVVNTLTLVAGPFVFSWGLFFAGVELFSGILIPEPDWPHPAWWVYVCAAYVSGVGVLYMVLHLFRRADERLGVVTRLRESLGGVAGSEGPAANGINTGPVSAKIRDQIARIERKQIWEHRAASISSFDADSDMVFALLKSRAFHDAEAELDPTTSLRVQDEIVSLAQGPAASDIVDSAGIRWRLVPEASLRIGYSADQSTRRIRVLELRDASKPASTTEDSP